MRLLTYGTDMTPGLERFLQSARRYGWRTQLVGLGEPYPGHIGRLQRMLPIVASMRSDTLVLFTDGYDSVMTGTRAEAEERYRRAAGAAGDIMVFGAEVECHPHPLRAAEWPPTADPYRFLNAGGWAGPAGAFVQFWQRLRIWKLPPELNDQAVIGDCYVEDIAAGRDEPFVLDRRAELFQNLFAAEGHVRFDLGRPTNVLTGTHPVIVHASGHCAMPAEAV